MSDTDIDCPYDERSNNSSYPLAPIQKKDNSTSRRIGQTDRELKDDHGDNIDGDEGHLARRSNLAFFKNFEKSQATDFDSDEDTFADAESDCEPNESFLAEMLEDSHPERLSLFDYTKINNSSTGMSPTSDAQNDENDVVDDSDDEKQKYMESSTSRNREVEANRTWNDAECESTSEGSEEADDSFGNLPMINHKGKGRGMPLNFNGTSTGAGPGRPILRQPSQRRNLNIR